MATRYQGPGTTSAGAFFQNQRAAPAPGPAGYMPKPPINMNASMSSLASSMSGMPQPQMQPLAQPRTRQGSNGGTPRTPGSTGSGGGGGSGKRMDRKDTKDTAWVHWRALREFLAAWADKESPTARASARDKLTRLTRLQFLELSTDVYDELMRRLSVERGSPEGAAPFLPVRDDFHPKRNQARQKLATLPKNRFKDLASDVFYELRRRYPEFDDDTSLYGGDDAQSTTGPPRSDSRSALSHDRKGSGLSSGGGGQMASVLRSQNEAQPESKRFATPTAATSDIVVPNKSTITEEAIEVPYARDSVDGDETRFRASTPASVRKNSRDEIVSPRTTEENGPGWHERDSFISNTTTRSKAPGDADAEDRIRKEYELRVAGLERRCNALEGEKDELSRQLADERERRKDYEDEVRGLKERATTHASSLRSIQHELDVARDAHAALREQTDASARAASDEAGEWRSRAEALEDELRRLESEHANCGSGGGADEAVVAELQGEVKSLVEELNALSVQNEDLVLASERQREAYAALEGQLAESRKQFQAARTELRNLKATSVMFTSQPMSEDHLPASPDGNIADMHVSAFQSAIDALLSVARSSQPTGVLPAMKAIVEAVTAIGEDVKAFEDAPNLDVDVSKLESLKHDSTTRLGALMTAARNHAMASGLSPVGLIDAAAGTLSANVVEIIKLLKIRRTGAAREILKKRASMSIADMVRRTPFDEADDTYAAHEREANATPSAPAAAAASPRVSPGRTPVANGANGSVNGHSPGGYAPLSPKSPAARAQPLGGGSKYETPAFQTLSASSSANGVPDLRINSFQSATTRSDSFDLERKQSSASGGSYNSASPHQRSPSGHRRQPSSPAHTRQTSSRSGDREWDDVKPYLNTQSSALVSSIQSLLAAIRTGDQGQTLNQHLSEVIAISSSIVGVTRNCIPPALRARGDELLRDLVANTNRLSEAQETSRGEQFDKQTRQEIANYSFGVAKSLKALMKLGAE